MKAFDCTPNEMTGRYLAVMAWWLQKYFDYSPDEASESVIQYYTKHSQTHDDELYQHEGTYWMALRVHFVESLQGNPGEFHVWRVRQGFTSEPTDQSIPNIFTDF